MMKKVLVLGAGRVASPLIEYLHRDPAIAITIACEIKTLGDNLANAYSGVDSILLDVVDSKNQSTLEELIKNADIVVSLLPPNLHYPIVHYSENAYGIR